MQQMMRLRRAGLIMLYCVLLGGGWVISRELFEIASIEMRPMNEPTIHLMLMTTIAIFAIASALPFVPGAEIGFWLMFVFGSRMGLLVYVSMVAALLAAYMIGRLVPLSVTASAFKFFGFVRAHDLVMRFSSVTFAERPKLLLKGAPKRFVPFLVRHRYVALALLFNLPGNSLLGGGGGIALSAGLSRFFSFPGYVITVLLAVAPVPLLFMFIG